MPKSIFLLVGCFFFSTASLHGQCTSDRNGAWKHIIDIIDSPKLLYKEKLKILRDDLEKMDNCPYKNDSTHAFLLQIIAEAYFMQSDFLNAVKYYRQSIKLIMAHAGESAMNPKKLILNYYWLSNAYDSLNNIPEKMKAADSCINIAFKLNSSSDITCIRALYERVIHSFDIGDYSRCIEDAGMCERLAREYIKTLARNSYYYRIGEFIVSSSLGWYVKAQLIQGEFGPAENFLLDKPDEYKKAGLENYLGLIYSQLASIGIHKGDYAKALVLFNQGFDYARKAGNNFTCKQILNVIASEIYLKHFKDGDKALAYYKKALTYTSKERSGYWEERMESLDIFTGMANIYVQKGLFDLAFRHFQFAFDQVKPGITENDILHSSPEEISSYPKLYYLANLLISKGDAYQKKYIVTGERNTGQQAVHIYKIADRLLEITRLVQFDLESKLFWRKDSRRLYEHAIESCYSQGNTADAFIFFEKSRAQLLNDQLTRQHWMDADDISRMLQAKKKALQLERELDTMRAGSKKYDEVQSDLFASKQEIDNLDELIRMNTPLYYQSTDTTYMGLPGVQKNLLKDHQALLEIFSGDSAVYTLLVTPVSTYINKLDKSDFEKTSSGYIRYISTPGLLNSHFDDFRMVSHHLYKLIFQNAGVPGGRIIISPDGDSYFPFESLVTDNSFRDPVYFLTDHAVSYTYSARYLENNFAAKKTISSGNFLGIAPVHYPPGFHLPALSGSDLSLERIGSYMSGAHDLVAKKASRNNFLQQFPGYKIIQLYTHASDSSDRKEPVIYFADSSLYLSDLIPENIPATQLIVLSACETGNGKLYQGEGVFSFNRGFAAMGIPSSISNLWSVDNLSTYQLTENLYKYLSDGLPVDIALQKAKLEFLRTATGEKKLPYFWAPAILVGKTDAIEYKKFFPWKSVFLLAAIAAILGWAVVIIRQKRKR